MTAALPPAGWYPDPSGGTLTRYWDGRQWGPAAPSPPPPPPKKKKSNAPLIIGIIGAVFVGLMILGSIGSGNENKQGAPSVSASATPGMPSIGNTAVPSAKPPAARPPTPSVGQEVRDGQFAFTVTSVDRSKIAGDLSNEFEQVTAQGEFLNLHMTVANTGNHAQTFFATNQKLKVGDKAFDADGTAAFWTHAADVTINPGNSIQVVVSFDVPPGSSGGTVQLHDSVFSGGVEVALQ